MIKRYLLTLLIAAVSLGGCTKPKPVTLNGQDYYLVSMDKWKGPYKQIQYQFGKSEVKIFAIKRIHPMLGDVIIGHYLFTGNVLQLSTIGDFFTKQTAQGYDLYNKGKVKYRLTKKQQPYIQPEVTAQHQSQFVSITK